MILNASDQTPNFPTLQPVVAQPVVPERMSGSPTVVRLDSLKADALLRGLIKLLVRRGVISGEDLQRTIANMVESGEINVTRDVDTTTI